VTKPLADFADDEETRRAADDAARAVAHARRQRDSATKAVKALEAENAELLRVVDLFGRLDGADPRPPKWLSPAKPKAHHGTLLLLLSDLHFDEVVRPAEVDGLNAYNRQIATLRLEAWVQNVVKLTRHYLSGVAYDGFVLMLGGDTFSGNIHDELKETNEDTIFGSLLYWAELLAAALDLLADEFGKGHVVAVPGNHGRLTRKPRMKLRSRDNLDWMLAQMLARQFRGDQRLTFQIPEALDCRFEVYGRGQLLAHGDAVHGGSGIGGIWPPIKRYRARLAEHANATRLPFETLWLGHWHQLIQTPSLVVNGAMKGYDEYAKACAFGFEPAQQALAVMTPEHGITWQAPVFCTDRKKEGW
jgi:hypothetical protein